MKFTLEQLAAVSFHDATLIRVDERAEYLSLLLDFAFVGSAHPDAEGKDWVVRDCLFECFGVRKSEKEEWDDDKAPRPHAEPEFPIEEFLHEEITNGYLVLSGFTRDQNWGIWRIEAREFSLTWKTRDEFKYAD